MDSTGRGIAANRASDRFAGIHISKFTFVFALILAMMCGMITSAQAMDEYGYCTEDEYEQSYNNSVMTPLNEGKFVADKQGQTFVQSFRADGLLCDVSMYSYVEFINDGSSWGMDIPFVSDGEVFELRVQVQPCATVFVTSSSYYDQRYMRCDAADKATFATTQLTPTVFISNEIDGKVTKELARHLGVEAIIIEGGVFSNSDKRLLEIALNSNVYPTVIVAGGLRAVSDEIYGSIESILAKREETNFVRRVAGTNRFETLVELLKLLPDSYSCYDGCYGGM